MEEYIESIELRDITLINEIGSGTCGNVFVGNYASKKFAVKKFKPYGRIENVRNELRKLRTIRHPNIIALIGDASQDNNLYSLMEYADGGTLNDFLYKSRADYKLIHVVNWALQSYKAVAYLHLKCKLIHGALRPSNMLLMDNRRVLKISDFASIQLEATTNTNMRTTVPYTAPEVNAGKAYGFHSDIYSLAIVLWEMLSGQKPYENISSSLAVVQHVQSGNRPPLNEIEMGYPETMATLMTNGWKPKPEVRPNITDFVDTFTKCFEEHGIVAAQLSI